MTNNEMSLNVKKSFQSTADQNVKIMEYMNLLIGNSSSAERKSKNGMGDERGTFSRNRRARTRMDSII